MFRNLTKVMNTKYGKIAISMILGFGLASLFRQGCKDRNCLVFKGPPISELENQVYKHGNSCYTFTPESTQCDNSKKIIDFHRKNNNA